MNDKAGDDKRFLGFKLVDLMPDSFTRAVERLATMPHFELYPVFWQWFMWIFGGFVLLDFEDRDHQLLSAKTGLPIEAIPSAFAAYDLLFPNPGGWFHNSPSRVRALKLFSMPFRGVGANYRRLKYSQDKTYDSLQVTGQYTRSDLKAWNNLAYSVLSR